MALARPASLNFRSAAVGVAASALLSMLSSPAAQSARYAGVDVAPPLPAKIVSDTHWGVAVEDPYRFLEDTSDPVVQKWMRDQADATLALLAKVPARNALLKRLQEIDAAVPAVIGQVHRDARGGVTYLKRNADENQFKLYRRDQADGQDRVLVDVDAIVKATGKPHAIDGFSVSPDGRAVAYGLSASGTEIGTLNVIDSASGKALMPPIDRIRGAGATWLPDGSGFFYARLPADFASRPRAERFMDHRTYFRSLSKPDDERLIFGSGVDASIALSRSDYASIAVPPGKNLVLAIVSHGVLREVSAYHATLDGVLSGAPRWQKLFDSSAGIQDVALSGPALYVRSAQQTPRYKVLRMPLDRLALDTATVVVPEGEGVIDDIAGTAEALLLTRREGVEKRLYRLGTAPDAKLEAIALPVTGNVRIANAHGYASGAVLALSGWTRATRHFFLDDAGRARDMQLAPVGAFDSPENVVAREVRVKSHDGVEVPVSILMHRDTKLDGRSPLMLYGYGAYGSVEEPAWSPRVLAWLERGGIYAIAHVRGGGVFGDAWRRAGWKTTKPNTWKDGIAVAEWLIENGYTSKSRLSIFGGSAGGIFVGRAITERPDLFRSAVIAVGNVDLVRSETRANGAANIPEYGTVTKEDEFRALLAMSPYANVKPGTAYPAVMFEHGVNDIRVDVWMSLKLASRLASATKSDAPVLLRLDYEGGHGVGATREQVQRQVADRWSFMLWQAGVEAFQPAAH
jgi:prolyl oligopeptidase